MTSDQLALSSILISLVGLLVSFVGVFITIQQLRLSAYQIAKTTNDTATNPHTRRVYTRGILTLFSGFLLICFGIFGYVRIASPSQVIQSPTNAVLTCNTLVADPDDISRVQTGEPSVADVDISDPQEAINACSIALKTATGQTAARLEHQLARALRKIGQTDAADAQDHLASDAGYAPAQAKWAEALFANQDYLGAFKLFSQAAPGSAEAMFRLGEAFYLNGFSPIVDKDRAKGIALIKEAARHNQPDALTHPCVVSNCSPN